MIRRAARSLPSARRGTTWAPGIVAAAAAAVLGAAGLDRVAWGFLGLSWAALGSAVWLSFRAVFAALDDGNAVRIDQRSIEAIAEQVNGQSNGLSRKVTSLHKQLKHLPYVNVELARRHAQLINDDLPMPVLGTNWAVTAPTLLFILDEVLGAGRRRILECGSGASTVWTAAALRHRGEGHVFALEDDKRFAEQTRQNLRDHGLENWATVIDAPLIEHDVQGVGSRPWYDLTGLGGERGFELLFVDGPPGSTARHARYPAVPQLLPRLVSGAVVVLDDTNRAQERKVVGMWSAEGAFNRPISVVKDVGQSTVLRVDV